MATPNESIHRNQFCIGFTAARGSSNYIHSGYLVWYTERSEPFDVGQRRRDFTKLGREIEKEMNLGETETWWGVGKWLVTAYCRLFCTLTLQRRRRLVGSRRFDNKRCVELRYDCWSSTLPLTSWSRPYSIGDLIIAYVSIWPQDKGHLLIYIEAVVFWWPWCMGHVLLEEASENL